MLIGLYSCTHDRLVSSEDFDKDTDGDGIIDSDEMLNGTNKNDPCDPVQSSGYTSYDPLNILWSIADCDSDGTINSDEVENNSDPYVNESLNPDDRIYPIASFLPTLSELMLFEGNLSDLNFNETVHEYSISTSVFSDYSKILRSIALPRGTQMTYNGEGLFNFPENTILTQTFYYLNDERDPDLGKKIIETRVMIKLNGTWTTGNYLWNEQQTEANYDENIHSIQIDWIDNSGNDRSTNYKVLSSNFCVQCHDYNSTTLPIGPKARALNFVYNGSNQIQKFIDLELLAGAPDISQIEILPNWSDETNTLEDRARAYLDVNCAHCHQPGGSYNVNYGGEFDLSYETSFEDSKINDVKIPIVDRMSSPVSGYFMPLIGSTVIHTEGFDLIDTYIDSLD
ncbi:hypothetical protein [Maribacter sp. HTCC2170]|uniref:hypothetical protein n=1 Tax=Maribacter sp. (strain HTCC2170 / KCCM 42371) TaxID=313603 RepID=UPI000674F33D|nr:hypothetical protein [Maribacter sp. HTCC2170]